MTNVSPDSGRSYEPGGKYRLTGLQVRVERLLGERVHTAKSLAREPAIIAWKLDTGQRWKDPEGRIRTVLNGLEELGLVKRIQFSQARHGYALSDEGSTDLLARGDA